MAARGASARWAIAAATRKRCVSSDHSKRWAPARPSAGDAGSVPARRRSGARRARRHRRDAKRSCGHRHASGWRSNPAGERRGSVMRRHGVRCSGRSQAQAARGRQLRLADDADDEGEALRAQALLHGPQGIAGARRLDEQPGRRLEPQSGKAVPVGRTELAGKDGRPAPQDARRTRRRSASASAGGARRGASAKPSAAAQLAGRQRPIGFGLHLMQGGGIEAAAKTLVDLGGAERPRR